jgi:hypothetical protein
MDADDPDQMSFSDACKALEIASRLGAPAGDATDTASAPGHGLDAQLTTLLDQAYTSPSTPSAASSQPQS